MAKLSLEEPLPSALRDNGLVNALRDTYNTYSQRRDALGLSNPGTVERLKREVDTDVFLTKYMFTGLKADLTKPFSLSPLFQYSHAFAMGSQQMPPYGFSAIFGQKGIFMQGNIDNEGQLSAALNYQLSKSFVTKTQASISPGQQSMFQLDGDYSGKDFSASIKSVNPTLLDGGLSGILVGSYLQSVTPGLALGVEAAWQRLTMGQGPETILSYCAKYRGQDWIGTAQLTGQGALSTSYWRRLTEKVEAGVDLNLQFAPGLGGGGLMGAELRKEGSTTLGAKYDFKASTFRAQFDSSGKVSCLLEKRLMVPMQLSFAGELDHAKSSAKVGMAISIEFSPEQLAREASAGGPTEVPF